MIRKSLKVKLCCTEQNTKHADPSLRNITVDDVTIKALKTC
jgi:hypothetical protein